MTEMEPHQHDIDGLLRSTLAAPMPALPPDFDQRLMSKISRRSQPLDRYRQVLLAGYGLVSIVVSTVLMRGQGLGWGAIAATILAPLAVAAVVRSAWHSRHQTTPQRAR